MTRSQRRAMLAAMIEELKDKGSWCGETHVQKAAFLAQELLRIPLGYSFRLYKHGPYSFDLTEEFAAMRADEEVILRAQPYPYGPTFELTPAVRKLMQHQQETVERYRPKLDFLANMLGTRGVAELERISTAYLVTMSMDSRTSQQARAERLHHVKPHIPLQQAAMAVEEVDGLIASSRNARLGESPNR